MRGLITQTLLGAYQYMFECQEEYIEEAQEAFMRTLRREPQEPTKAMQNGIAFENVVYRLAAGEKPAANKWAPGAQKVAEYLKGAQIQVRMERPIKVDGNDYLVYGIADGIKAGTIYDVKFSNKSLGSSEVYGKYLKSPQHPTYFYLCPGADRFQYLVSDGRDIYTGDAYEPSTCVGIWLFIEDMMQYLEKHSLMDLYREKWRAME